MTGEEQLAADRAQAAANRAAQQLAADQAALDAAVRAQRLLDPETREWLRNYRDGHLVCREGHDWPKITRPKGKRGAYRPFSRIEPQADGTSLVEQECNNCRMPRWRLTGTGGIFSVHGQHWHYGRHPDGYNQPAGYGLTRVDFVNEAWRRYLSEETEAGQ